MLLHLNEYINETASSLESIFMDLSSSTLDWKGVLSLVEDTLSNINQSFDHPINYEEHCLNEGDEGCNGKFLGYEPDNIAWVYLDVLHKLFKFLLEDDWQIENMGTFITRTLNLIGNFDCTNKNDLKLTFHDIFTLPEKGLSLPDISYLYNIVDNQVLDFMMNSNGDVYKNKDWNPPEFLNVNESFKNCFSSIINSSKKGEAIFDGEYRFRGDDIDLPCRDYVRYPICQQYCRWHEKIMVHWNKKEFLSIMKQASPSRTMIPAKVTRYEQKIFSDVFKSKMKDNTKHVASPMAPIVFCYDRSEGFNGINVGMSGKICNKFFHTPTDIGMCLTKNLKIRDILHSNPHYAIAYDELFESELQSDGGKFKSDTLGSEMIFAVNVDGTTKRGHSHQYPWRQTIPRSEDLDLDEFMLQIHPSSELAKLLLEKDYHLNMMPIKLRAGKEYFIDVTPSGTRVSEDFKSLVIQKRGCLIESDYPTSLTFKTYSKSNCQYECFVNKAQEICDCIPWDFIDNNSMKHECDIFGRTCFFKTMKNLSLSQINHCPGCKKKCEEVQYHTKSDIVHNGAGWSLRNKELDDLLNDVNHTFVDMGFKKAYDSLLHYKNYEDLHQIRRSKFALIHIRFLTPEFKRIDLKYSSLDRIANFGGKFGIFAQLTGCSFLVIVKIIFVLFKTFFSSSKRQSIF